MWCQGQCFDETVQMHVYCVPISVSTDGSSARQPMLQVSTGKSQIYFCTVLKIAQDVQTNVLERCAAV